MVEALLKSHNISSINEGAEFLVKGKNGWTHNFISKKEIEGAFRLL